MTILVDIIPAAYRRYVYALVALVGLVLGTLELITDWSWVTVALTAYAFVTTATGLTSYANTTGTPAKSE